MSIEGSESTAFLERTGGKRALDRSPFRLSPLLLELSRNLSRFRGRCSPGPISISVVLLTSALTSGIAALRRRFVYRADVDLGVFFFLCELGHNRGSASVAVGVARWLARIAVVRDWRSLSAVTEVREKGELDEEAGRGNASYHTSTSTNACQA